LGRHAATRVALIVFGRLAVRKRRSTRWEILVALVPLAWAIVSLLRSYYVDHRNRQHAYEVRDALRETLSKYPHLSANDLGMDGEFIVSGSLESEAEKDDIVKSLADRFGPIEAAQITQCIFVDPPEVAEFLEVNRLKDQKVITSEEWGRRMLALLGKPTQRSSTTRTSNH
jgi:hypothetical protein